MKKLKENVSNLLSEFSSNRLLRGGTIVVSAICVIALVIAPFGGLAYLASSTAFANNSDNLDDDLFERLQSEVLEDIDNVMDNVGEAIEDFIIDDGEGSFALPRLSTEDSVRIEMPADNDKAVDYEINDGIYENPVVLENLQIVYASENMIVYKGPGTEYQALGIVNQGDVIIKTGDVDEWIQIKYEDTFGYILSKDVSLEEVEAAEPEVPEVVPVQEAPVVKEPPKTQEAPKITPTVQTTNKAVTTPAPAPAPAAQIPESTNNNANSSANQAKAIIQEFTTYGTAGRLYVNGINVALYNDGTSGSQATVDAKDSASFFRYKGTTIICDHTNQGFSAIKTVKVGDEAYIKYEDGSVLTLICTGTDQGHNLTDDIVDSNGNSVYGAYPIVMYTCNENWHNVTIVFWDIK